MAGCSSAKQRRGRVNKPKYQAYRNSGQREINKAYKLIKHLEKSPKDRTAQQALKEIYESYIKAAKKKLKLARSKNINQ